MLSFLTSFKEKFKKVLKDHAENRAKNREFENHITYYPRFPDQEKLNNHYYRACWYLPKLEGKCEEVYLFTKAGQPIQLGPPPEYMCQDTNNTDHIKVKSEGLSYLKTLYKSRMILMWEKKNLFVVSFLKLLGIKVIDVETDDPAAVEYGVYCSIYWKNILTDKEKQLVIQESFNIFSNVADEIKKENYKRSCVFGTGPSLEDAYQFNFDHCLTIACNSIVQNDQLLDHIKPYFICAGDVVSHLGASKYAEVFRNDLFNALRKRELYFVTTAAFGYILLLNNPEMRGRIILIDQTTNEPVYNLLHSFGLPRLDSTLNIHMLPIAGTFTDEIFILGCDGKSTKRDNEDFWAHAHGAQYHDLVDTGHKCHPTFDINRKKSTYNRHLDSVHTSISNGENKHNKKYYTLKQSNISALVEKTIPDTWINDYKENGKVKISSFPVEQIKNRNIEENPLKGNPLKTIGGLSNAEVDGDNILRLKGWILSGKTVEKIKVYCGDDYYGNAITGIRRPDLYKKYPQYNNENAGFIFTRNVNEIQKSKKITVRIYAEDKIIKEIEENIVIKN